MKQFTETLLLTSDQNSSVLRSGANRQRRSYTPFGFIQRSENNDSTLAFNGQPLEAIADQYLLGNGYRAYNPILMRFNSPDSYSPFAAGGINCYAYVGSEPVGFTDPTGHNLVPSVKKMRKIINNPDLPVRINDKTMHALKIMDEQLQTDPLAREIFARGASKLNLYQSTSLQTAKFLETPQATAKLPIPKRIADDINQYTHYSAPTRYQQLAAFALDKNHAERTIAKNILEKVDLELKMDSFVPRTRSLSDTRMKLYSAYFDRAAHRPHLLVADSKHFHLFLNISLRK